MKRVIIGVVILFVGLALSLQHPAQAQSGNVIYLGAVIGTTKAANCGTPTTPSLCIVGDGVWVWQSNGWFLIQPPAVGVTSVNGKTGVVVLGVSSTIQ